MADQVAQQWRQGLSAMERYDNIQNIKAILEATSPTDEATTPTHQRAFAIETEAYSNATTREQYNSACLLKSPPGDSAVGHRSHAQGDHAEVRPESPGITIGNYHECHYISGGVTSQVYRCKAVALKVIVETHNIEPHNPLREAKILELLEEPCIIRLLETFRDQEQRLVLAMPYMPLTLQHLIDRGPPLERGQVTAHFGALFRALAHIHAQGIIHRDIKPSAVLLASPHQGPAYLSDFGTAWHPGLSSTSEPADNKILDIGTGPYRAPEVLFGDKSYTTAVDIWAAGVMLTECCRRRPRGGDPAAAPLGPIFESRAVHEDGNQLSLILSIFKTIGSPTPETWPAAKNFRTPPFEMYQSFAGRPWADLLVGVDEDVAGLIQSMLRYESSTRPSAEEILASKLFDVQSAPP
ncbi:kinase-like domain-containing protein [Microdochium trichocladiopsis]|uniref:cyclin-dependent kinase n=1 Tax=Microdochium trichocladiopsis TaxID=1682393 RepID=A0A9P8Y794_9PEZI|nr:kinase-like domain-containing protein [Microdochium trichocladiopsis]KAH7031616.1 kinase-like domain-containing protein [Microdochium trichocladiopsis]